MCLVQDQALPVYDRLRPLEVLAEGVAEFGIGIDGALALFRGVLEHPPPGREGGEGEGVAHVDIAGQRQRRGLRPGALGDHRRGAAQRVAHGFRDIVTIEQGDEGDRAAALLQQKVEHVALLVIEHADLARQRHLDGALAHLFEHIGIGL